MDDWPQILGRSMRILLGESVYEDAEVTLNEGRLWIEFAADDRDSIMVDLRELLGDRKDEG